MEQGEQEAMRNARNPFIKTIEYMMFREKEIKQAVYEARNDGKHVYGGNSSGKAYNNPTAEMAEHNLKEIETVEIAGGVVKYPERWLAIINIAYKRHSGIELDIMKARYRRKENISKVLERNHISKSTYQHYLDNIRNFLLVAAVQKGVVKII